MSPCEASENHVEKNCLDLRLFEKLAKDRPMSQGFYLQNRSDMKGRRLCN